MFSERRKTLNNPFFGLVKGIINRWALTEVNKLKEIIGNKLQPYTNTYTTISGVPCKHAILHHINSENPRLLPSDFHHHWFYDPVNYPGPQ